MRLSSSRFYYSTVCFFVKRFDKNQKKYIIQQRLIFVFSQLRLFVERRFDSVKVSMVFIYFSEQA